MKLRNGIWRKYYSAVHYGLVDVCWMERMKMKITTFLSFHPLQFVWLRDARRPYPKK
ncbi:hypothetical protein PILCRDRAFT_209831 [Piloderma croceum F 1598]|uniref:Uncharacterized protein n=1 Tax=Piloderma croceum (strain F 1598) TaxID=765440 RepID=A0A0C3CH26_PILCF|nr:hypothetical protein PILCRDRAFT_209831 [Piloderma croceum F 1598]